LIGALAIHAPMGATGVLTIREGPVGLGFHPNPLPIEIPPVRVDVAFVPEPALCGPALGVLLMLRRH